MIKSYIVTLDRFQANLEIAPRYTDTSGPSPVDLMALTKGAGPNTYSAGGFTVTKVRSTNKAYNLRLNISAPGGTLLGYLLTNPTSGMVGMKHLRPFHGDNKAFYTLNFGQSLLDFLHNFGLKIYNITQLDIALDTQQQDPAKLIQKYTNQYTKYQRIKHKSDKGPKIAGTMDEITAKQQCTTYWGKGSKTKSLKIYDKTQELTQNPKDYITDWHTASGFNATKPVYRIEVSIHSRALKKYRSYPENKVESGNKSTTNRVGPEITRATKFTETTTCEIEPARFNQPAYLTHIFKQFFPIEIREIGHSRNTNNIRVPIIDFDFYGIATVNTSVSTRPSAQSLTLDRQTVKRLVIGYRDTNEDHYLASAWGVAAAPLASFLTNLLTSSAPIPTPVLS